MASVPAGPDRKRDGRRAATPAAEREQRRARLRAEAETLRNDPDDVATSRELAAEMDAVRTRPLAD